MSEATIIDDLFNVSTKVELAGKTIYLRTLSEVDLQARDTAAMAAARAMRRTLKDPSSSIYQTYVGGLGDSTREEMIDTLHALHDIEFIVQAEKEVTPLYKPYPQKIDADETGKEKEVDLTLEDKLKVQDEREEEREATQKKRIEHAEKLIAKYDADIKERSDEEILKELRDVQVKSLIDAEYFKELNDQTILFTCYSDEKCTKRFFRKIDEVRRINPAAKKALLGAYREIDSFDLWTLKN